MLRKTVEKIDDILSYFCDYSILIDLYLPLFGKKRRAFYDKKYGYAIEEWFYPDNKTDYKCIYFSPRDILFLEE